MLRGFLGKETRWLTILILFCVVTGAALCFAAFTVDLKPVFGVQLANQVITYTDSDGRVQQFTQLSTLPIGSGTQIMTRTTTIQPLAPAGQ